MTLGGVVTQLDDLLTLIGTAPLLLNAKICKVSTVTLPDRFALPEAVLTEQGKSRQAIMFCNLHHTYHLYPTKAGTVAQHDVLTQLRAKAKQARIEGVGVGVERALALDAIADQDQQLSSMLRRHRARFGDWKTQRLQKLGATRPAVTTLQATLMALSGSQQREFYRCMRKRVFVLEVQAEAARLERRPAEAARLSVYVCEYCTGWHLGHAPKPGVDTTRVQQQRLLRAVMRYDKKFKAFVANV